MPSKVTTQSVSTSVRTIDFVQSDQFNSRISPDVNRIPSKLFRAYSSGVQTDPMIVTNYTETSGGGGLASRDYDFVPAAGQPMWFGMDFLISILAGERPSYMRLELDDKVMVADGTKLLDASGNPTLAAQMNESHEWNDDTKSWQYDPDGNGWQDIGFNPKPFLLTDPTSGKKQVNDIRFRWWWNGIVGDGGLWSSLAMAQNGEVFTAFGSKFRDLPLIKAKWGGPLRHPQVQTEYRGAVPGSHTFEVVRARLLDGTTPIDINLPWA